MSDKFEHGDNGSWRERVRRLHPGLATERKRIRKARFGEAESRRWGVEVGITLVTSHPLSFLSPVAFLSIARSRHGPRGGDKEEEVCLRI